MRARILLCSVAIATGCLGGVANAGPTTLLVIADTGECGVEGSPRVSEALRRQPDWQQSLLVEVGDLAYPVATRERLAECHEPYFGMFANRVAAPGNHDWYDADGRGLFEMFPGAVPRMVPLVGRWVLWLLNSNLRRDAAAAQLRWIERAAQDDPERCVIAAWHHPRWTSAPRGAFELAQPLWQAVAGTASFTLHGHDHHYEAVPPLDSAGQPAERGTRSFVVGTGGAVLDPPSPVRAGSNAVFGRWGFLRIDLDGEHYRWQAVAVDGSIVDDGAGRCLARERTAP